jgi:hypothetical protein
VPAAAVIPAPIAYIKVVAVKKLVVEFLANLCLRILPGRGLVIRRGSQFGLHWSAGGTYNLL